MGLAASQVSLLLLTGRLTDVEGKLQTIANARLALSRRSADNAKEYNNALDARKLVWSNGSDSNTNLTYDLLMSPNSAAGGQYLLSDSYGRVILNDDYANIFGSSASSGSVGNVTLNDFLVKKMGCSATDADKYINNKSTTPTNNNTDVTVASEDGIKYKDADVWSELASGTFSIKNGGSNPNYSYFNLDDTSDHKSEYGSDGDATRTSAKISTAISNINAGKESIQSFVSSVATDVFNALQQVLTYNNDSFNSSAFQVASNLAITETQSFYKDHLANLGPISGARDYPKKYNLAFISAGNNPGVFIGVENVVDMLLTNFDKEYAAQLSTNNAKATISGGCTDISKSNGIYTRATETSIQPANATNGKDTPTPNILTNQDQADFYINLYDQIASKGWVRNSSIDQNGGKSLQNMLLNGNAYLYQYKDGNWSMLSSSDSDSPLKNVADEDASKKAEIKYEQEKDELDYKEKEYDLETNNLDTERSALNTQIDSIKQLIPKKLEILKLYQTG